MNSPHQACTPFSANARPNIFFKCLPGVIRQHCYIVKLLISEPWPAGEFNSGHLFIDMKQRIQPEFRCCFFFYFAELQNSLFSLILNPTFVQFYWSLPHPEWEHERKTNILVLSCSSALKRVKSPVSDFSENGAKRREAEDSERNRGWGTMQN